jgi:hypothetical protein
MAIRKINIILTEVTSKFWQRTNICIPTEFTEPNLYHVEELEIRSKEQKLNFWYFLRQLQVRNFKTIWEIKKQETYCEFKIMIREMTNIDYISKTCQYVCKTVDTKYKLCSTHVLSGNGKISLNTYEHLNVPTVGLNWVGNVMYVFWIIKQPAYIYNNNLMRYNLIRKALRDLNISAY